MKIFKWLLGVFDSFGPNRKDFMYRGTGALLDVDDYRDVYVSMFQKQTEALPDRFVTDISMLEILDQGGQPACVGHALAIVIAFFIYLETGAKEKISARFIYAIAKLFDGIRFQQGTHPRVAINGVLKYGAPREYLFENNILLPLLDYIDLSKATPEVYEEANMNRIKGFARVDETVDAIKLALVKNKILTASFKISTWYSLPLEFFIRGTWHYVVIYGYEPYQGKTKLFIRNSWSNTWLSWIYNWIFPGNGYLILEDYIQNRCITDIYAYTDIPADILEKAKAKPFKFTRTLNSGSTGVDVKELQKYLNADPETAVALDTAGSKDQETMTFGPATFRAVQKWQRKYGIRDTGTFGPLSIARVNNRIPKMTLLEALMQVESGGNDNAIGDKHLSDWAYGCLQIRQPMVTDVNKYLGTNYKAQDCLGNRALSFKIFDTYFKIYPKLKTDEEKAKAWNGGAGWRSLYGKKGYESYTKNLDIYWSKVKKLLF